MFPRSRQSRRDLPMDNPLVSIEVLRNRVNTYAVRITMLIADIEDDIMDPGEANSEAFPSPEVYGLLSSCLLQYFSYKENEVFQDMQLIHKIRDDKKYMKKVEPSSRSKAIEDIISIGSFVEALVLNHYVLVRKIL
ncbi:hypothetical protein Tco_1080447 [Tanacetum coccineum]|uniref:Uncharacterized protein n=1 Tax=Tanacetum coccineum TaxID=301880 RepID=A0ABQ5HWC8_9ASTR